MANHAAPSAQAIAASKRNASPMNPANAALAPAPAKDATTTFTASPRLAKATTNAPATRANSATKRA